MKRGIFLFLLALFVFACTDSSDDEFDTDEVAYNAAEAYFESTLKPVITINCVSCHAGHHSQNNSSNYGNLTNAIGSASEMYNLVTLGVMPKDAGKLSQEDIDKFAEFLKRVNEIP